MRNDLFVTISHDSHGSRDTQSKQSSGSTMVAPLLNSSARLSTDINGVSMRRAGIWAFLAIATIYSWSFGYSMGIDPGAHSAMQDQSEIYKIFLTQWVGTDQKPINVSRNAEIPSAADMKDFAECAADGTQWETPTPTSDIASQISQFSFVRPTAPETWKPQDPQNLMAHGQSVGPAVDSGVSHGLMTLSAVVFDRTHHIAALKYSFVCGGLCGNGGTIIFIKAAQGWVRSKKECGTWIS